MDSVRTLIVGAGVTGLAAAAALEPDEYLILEADREIGGYCKTIRRDGFVWDYSGHFFHFKHPEIEQWLRERMQGQRVRVVEKKSFIAYGGKLVDFPFQKNIHQLEKSEFIDCLYDLYFARAPAELLEATAASGPPGGAESNFKEMLYGRFGKAISEKFLIPYNEKLYACDLASLDRDAMGRFFPHADLTDIVRNMKLADNTSYNSTFSYPEGGAFEYVKALASAVRPGAIALSEPLTSVDLDAKIATTPRRQVRFERLVSSAPLNRFAKITGIPHDPSVFSWNKVLVFNLGFDRKGPQGVHWIYYPDRQTIFYRIGFYDNIFETDRMSLYVEIGFPRHAPIDVPALEKRVLEDLEREGIIEDHRLVASHSVVMDPAYVHITRSSIAEERRLAALFRKSGVHSLGRYGSWTYCSIEDNIVQARAVVREL